MRFAGRGVVAAQGESAGYVYQRDGHPNADMLAEKLCELHGPERAR